MNTAALLLALLVGQSGPYKPGKSEHNLEGLPTTLWIPDQISAETPASLVLLLHGLGDTGGNLIHVLARWPGLNYVVCAPSATDRSWDRADVAAVLRIAAHLKKALPIDARKVHVMGFSNGGGALGPLAFDDALRPCSATWVGSGFRGGKVPKWAKKGMGVLAMAGADDRAVPAARATVVQLEDKVRSVELRLQEGLGHKWPSEFMPYLEWWMGVQEGRFKPGADRNFDWIDDLDFSLNAIKDQKRGGVLLYVYSDDDRDNPASKKLQNEVFMDPLVRFFGSQLEAVMLKPNDRTAALGVKTTPAVVVLKKDGTVKKLFAGKIKARSLASALRSVAPNRKKPKR